MSEFSKIAWSEGMFLRPQHFQQQDRHLQYSQQRRQAQLAPFSWGLFDYQLDSQCLKFSQFGLSAVRGILPDGTLLELPDIEPLPAPLSISKGCRDQQVYLCLAADKVNGLNIAEQQSSQITRFQFADHTLTDTSLAETAVETLQLARLRVLLKLESDDRSGFIGVAIARIREVTEHGDVKLDDKFIPPLLNVQRNPPLKALLSETLGMLNQRAQALSGRISKGQGSNSSSIADFLMLQVLNRYEPLLKHWQHLDGTNPLALYQLLVSMLGELATFTSKDKRPPEFPAYIHDELTTVFGNLAVIMNQTLSVVLEQTAQALPLEQAKFGILVSPLTDKTLLQYAQFVLAVSADLPSEEIRKHLPARLKIGPVEHIRELVNNQLPGIAVTGLPVAPRQVPYHAGYHYFQLDKSSIYWQRLANSGALALHLSGNYPGLKLELWAIKA
jgi:type VI secretion system protein ImpJ